MKMLSLLFCLCYENIYNKALLVELTLCLLPASDVENEG